MWKRFLIFDIVLIIAGTVPAAFWMLPVKTCGIISISTVDQLEEFLEDVPVRNALLEGTMALTDEEECERRLRGVTEEGAWLLVDDHTLQIYIVEPVEMYIQVGGTYEQAAWVTETLQGDSQPGEQILICSMGGTIAFNDEVSFFGNLSKNFMLPGNQYLVFCEQTEYSDSVLAEYRLIHTFLNVLNVSRDDEPFPEDFEPTGLWEQFRGRELLRYSNEEIEAFNALKQRVFEMYDVDLSRYRGQ